MTFEVDIAQHQSEVLECLARLKGDEIPVFGIMTAQQMVEHLAFVVRFSNGKAPQQLHTPETVAERIKAHVINTEKPLRPGFKSPVLPQDGTLPLLHRDMAGALVALAAELDDFHRHFATHPTDKLMNPVMGELDHAEWVIYHNKHFAHHLRQFNLIEPTSNT